MDEVSIGARLKALKLRSGRSFGDIAKAMGAPQRSSIQYFFNEDYRAKPGDVLDLDDAILIGSALAGHGDPPVTMGEIFALTALPQLPEPEEQPPLYSPEVAKVIAEVLGEVVLEGRKPPADVTAALALMLERLSAFYQRFPSARNDAGETRGALRSLASQFGPQGREPQPT